MATCQVEYTLAICNDCSGKEVRAVNRLSTYLKAIHGSCTTVSVADRKIDSTSYLDNGVQVNLTETLLRFNNGVVVKHTVERDESSPAGPYCQECWITYEVIETCGHEKSPQRKIFTSTCREAFWLKMQENRMRDERC